MTNEEIVREFNALPLEARREVEDFVAFLRVRYSKKKKAKKDFTEENFVGMWKDREDMENGEDWTRKIRQTEWTK